MHLSSKRLCQHALSLALATSLATPSFGFAADTKLIFPGEPLPKELGFSPLKVGTGGDSEVQVAARDWFLLKDKGQFILNPVLGKNLDFVGPVLDTSSTQIYFRIVSGMILKEAMVQAGMNAGQARRFIERSGAGFETAPLETLGELPKGLSYLFENWDRTPVRMAVLPNVMLPLAIAYDQSQLQHFAKATVDDSEAQKTCSTISTAAPVAPVQSKIVEKQKQMDSINTELRNAQSRLAQSKAEQVRMNSLIKDLSLDVDRHMRCFDSIKSRVSNGSAMPEKDCLTLAAVTMKLSNLENEWNKFSSVNLPNNQGDLKVKKETETRVRALEARVSEAQGIVRSLQEQQDKAQADLKSNEEKLKRLNETAGPEKSKESELEKEAAALKAELFELQTVDFKLKSPNLRSELSEDQVKALIAATPEREKRIAYIESRSKQIVPEQVKRQAYQASLLTQIQGVTGKIDELRAQSATLETQLNDKANGYVAKLEALKAELAVETPKFIKISDAATFAEYVVSILMKRQSGLGQSRDVQFNALKEEEARADKYTAEIAAASKDKDARYDVLAAEVKTLESLIVAYRDVAQMGWFLETDCAARATFSGQQPGIYLSRAKVTSAANEVPQKPVDGGKWGLFNLDFQHFQAPIQNGILLNVPAYVQMAVQQILENYDYAVTQTLDPAVAKCADVEAGKGSSSVLTMMRTAANIWAEGADAPAKAKAFQCGTNAMAAMPAAQVNAQFPPARLKNAKGAPVQQPVATAQAQPAKAVSTFQAALSRLLAFDGSVLDAALPQNGQALAQDLVERQAISALGKELAILGGSVRADADSKTRRDQTLKAMMRVLATDYESEIAKLAEKSAAQRTRYIFASAPPVKTASVGGLVAGQHYYVKTLAAVKLYTQPIAKPAYDANVSVSVNDVVTVLAMDGSADVVRGGWVKVQGAKQELWMPAWPLSAALLDESGREIQGVSQLQNCPKPRAVTSLHDARMQVTRYAANISARETAKNSGQFVIDAKTPTVAPAFLNRVYIACDTFSFEGQELAVRIVEAKYFRTSTNKVVYMPLESEGGYIAMQSPKGKGMQPALVLGAELDPSTWGPRQ